MNFSPFRELMSAWRGLRSRPAFFVTAVLTLMIGSGALAAIFTVYDAVLLKPLPFDHAERLVRVGRERPPTPNGSTPIPVFNEWRERTATAFDAIGGYAPEAMNLGGDSALRLAVYKVTPGFWEVFSQPIAQGRAFGDDEENRHLPVVVLGDALWRNRFNAAADIVGRDIVLNGDNYRVIGITRPGFRFPDDAQAWLPTYAPGHAQSRRDISFLRVLARLRADTSPQQAAVALQPVLDWQAKNFPEHDGGYRPTITPLQDAIGAGISQPLHMLLAAATLVLLIACANLANLMLARGQARSREMALRSALGAQRGQLLRGVLAEALLIAVLGAAAGLALAQPAVQALLALAPDLLPAYNAVQLDWRVIAAIILVAVATLLLFGLLPAWRAAAADPASALQGASRSQTSSHQQLRARSSLVSAEVALAVILLGGAGLLIDSLRQLGQVDSGVDTTQVLTAQISLPTLTLQPGDDINAWARRAGDQLNPRLAAIEQRLGALPGVDAVAVSLGLPASGIADWSSRFDVVGSASDEKNTVQYRFVSADYFRTYGIPLREGRVFSTVDGSRDLFPTELLVNETFARRYLAGGDALNRQIRTFGDAPIPVIGMVGDVRQGGIDHDAHPEIYFPISKALKGELSVAIKVQGDALAYAEPLRQALREVAPDAPVYAIRTLDDVIGGTLDLRRFNTVLMAAFAGVALLLAAIGLYGVIAYTVGQRRREIGLRQAIGANRAAIHRLMLGVGLRMIVPGLVVGLVGALALGQLISSQLYGVAATDPKVLLGVVVTLALVALAACAVPTLRAARVAPMEALGND